MYSVLNIIRAKIGALIFGHNFSFSRVIYWPALSLSFRKISIWFNVNFIAWSPQVNA